MYFSLKDIMKNSPSAEVLSKRILHRNRNHLPIQPLAKVKGYQAEGF